MNFYVFFSDYNRQDWFNGYKFEVKLDQISNELTFKMAFAGLKKQINKANQVSYSCGT